MVKVTRYNTISCVPGVMSLGEYELPTCEPVGEYQVDTSHFVPQCESGPVTLQAGEVGQGAYDFANGVDTGVNIPSSRLHSYTGDIAEASVNLRDASARASKSVDNVKVLYEQEQIKKHNTTDSNNTTGSNNANTTE